MPLTDEQKEIKRKWFSYKGLELGVEISTPDGFMATFDALLDNWDEFIDSPCCENYVCSTETANNAEEVARLQARLNELQSNQ